MKRLVLRRIIIITLFSLTAVHAYSHERIIVGSKAFTESHILAHMLKALLETEGYHVEEKKDLITSDIRPALLDGKLDIYWEYTGTVYSAFFKLKNPSVLKDSEKLFATVKELDYQKNKLLWLNKASFNNTYILVMNQKFAQAHSELKQTSDLVKVLKTQEIRFGLENSFFNRPDGFKSLQKHYHFQVPLKNVQIMARQAILGALKRGQVQIGLRYATDPEIKLQNLVVLEDDRSFFPVYNPAPVLLEETAKRYPKLVQIANRLGPCLDRQTMINLNYQVDIEKKAIEHVTRNWLKKVELIQ